MKTTIVPITLLLILCCTSCEEFWNHCIDGNGDRTTETRNLDAFTMIQVNGDFDVQVDTGVASFTVIEADENLMGFIVTSVSGDKLIIESRNGNCLKPSHPIEITVTTPGVSSIELNGSGFIYCNGISSDELYLNVSGSGQIECYEIQSNSLNCEIGGSGYMNISAVTEDLTAQVNGSGEIRLSGTAVSSDFSVIGSGNINSGNLGTDVCTAYISGSGTIDAYVNQALDVTIVGSGIFYYDGDPAITKDISGSGKVLRSN